MDQTCKSLILNPITLYKDRKDKKERCFIEPSINSCRVLRILIQVSLRFKELDEFDALINDKFSKFFSVRAEYFEVVRKKPIEVFLI